jgi:hypothetical protein
MEKYLVRVDNTRFLIGFDGVNANVVDTPSFATALPYAVADSWARRLRTRGFPQALVTSLIGEVMTYDRLKADLRAAEAGKTQDGLPNTRKELARIPVAEQRRRYRSDPRFAERLDILEAQQ